MIKYNDPFIDKLYSDIATLIEQDVNFSKELQTTVRKNLDELKQYNCPALKKYWQKTSVGFGLTDKAFKTNQLFYFDEKHKTRVFYTSGTTQKSVQGKATYSEKGLALMHLSIYNAAKRYIIETLNQPAIIRLIPSEKQAPEMIMAYGMDKIATKFGHSESSDTVITPEGLDKQYLLNLLKKATSDERPVILIGGSFAFINILDDFKKNNISISLPKGSKAIDAGGFKGRSRTISIDEMRRDIEAVFAIPSHQCSNIFGMTELASQLYDSKDIALGPNGERPKLSRNSTSIKTRDPFTLKYKQEGLGLLEICDYCVIDRPNIILTGDLSMQSQEGTAIIGRAIEGETRGCSLNLESLRI